MLWSESTDFRPEDDHQSTTLKTLPQPKDSPMRRTDPLLLTFISTALALALVSTAIAQQPPADDDSVWITLGEDAFDTLRKENLRFRNQPLERIDAKSDVVITRVARADLLQISSLIHEHHLRCAGFMSHSNLELAEDALAQASLPEFRAAPIEYLIDQPELADRVKARVSQSRILNTIRTLSTDFNNRYFAHASGRAASLWIRDQWQDHARSRPDVTVELYNHPWTQPSVILTIPGSTKPEEVVVLGGHLDSITGASANPNFNGPGADDNASGIAVLSEVIRAAMVSNFRPQRTVKFMGYAAEEVGLDGSQAIAQDFRRQGINVVAVVQFDMTAFNGSVEDISLLTDFTNGPLTTFTGRLIGRYLPNLTFSRSACGYACSDHASWTRSGYPAAMAFEARVGQHNGLIHTSNDTLATFGNTASHAVKFARLGAVFMVETAVDGDPAPPPGNGPRAPSQLQASARSTSTVDLSWRDNSGAESGFEIQGKAEGTYAVFATVAANEVATTLTGLDPETDYVFRVRALGNQGNSDFSNESYATTWSDPAPCVVDENTLCLNGERFKVTLDWLDHDGNTGQSHAVASGADDSGLLWFFNANNWEMLIKVIDGCGSNERFWVFAAATTDVEYRLRVTDSLTGAIASYRNPLGTASPAITDIEALATCSADDALLGGQGSTRNHRGSQAPTAPLVASRTTAPAPCIVGSEALCLNEGRFEITVDWEDFEGNTGQGQVVNFGTDDSGLFYFFGADNWELLVKVIDGCGANDRFWVFAGATTNVAYTLKVVDTETGDEKTWTNPLGTSADAITDTSAFATCP